MSGPRLSYDPSLHNWDPMSEDFHNREFNCYVRGSGAKLESQLQFLEKRIKDGYDLYVSGIPHEMTQDMFANIFSSCGKVSKVSIGRSSGVPYDYGFVTYTTLREAERAIRELNRKPPYNLRVEFKEDEESKIRRQMKNYNYNEGHDSDSSTLRIRTGKGYGRGASCVSQPRFNGIGINPQKFLMDYEDYLECYDGEDDLIGYENGYFNACKGSQFEVSHKIFDPTIHVDNSGSRTVSCGRGFYVFKKREVNYDIPCYSKERDTLLQKALVYYVSKKNGIYENDRSVDLPKDYVREKCKICHALTSNVCSVCEIQFYCSRNCQISDWYNHKNFCKPTKSSESNEFENKCENIPLRRPKDSFVNYASDSNEKRFNQNKRDSRKPTLSLKQLKGTSTENVLGDVHHNQLSHLSKIENSRTPRQSSDTKQSLIKPHIHKKSQNQETSNVLSAPNSPHKQNDFKIDEPNIEFVTSPSPKPSLASPAKAVIPSTESVTRTRTPTPKKPFFIVGVPTEVIAQYMISRNEFFVIKKVDSEKLNELNTKLQVAVHDESPSISMPTLKAKCAAKYQNTWYRAKISSLQPLKVLFVDYGNEEEIINPSDIKILPEEFCSTLPYTVKIHFNEDELVVSTEDWLNGKMILPVSKDVDSRWFVKLLPDDDQSDSKEEPVDQKCEDEPLSIQSTDSKPGQVDTISNSSPEKIDLASDYVPVTIENKLSSSSSSEQLNQVSSSTGSKNSIENYKPEELNPNTGLFDNLERSWGGHNIVEDVKQDSVLNLQINEILNERCVAATAICRTVPYWEEMLKLSLYLNDAEYDPDYRPQVGDMVGAPYTEDDWTRATVYSISGADAYNVFMPDKGCIKKDIKQVKKLPGESACYPHLGVTVNFHSDLTGSLEVGDLVQFSLKSQDRSRWIGKIKDVKQTNDGEYIAENEIATGYLEAWEPEFVDDGRLSCLKLQSKLTVVISAGHDSKTFYVKPVTKESIDYFENLAQEVAAYCMTAPHLDREPLLGELVAAMWVEDGNFYRAQVLKKVKDKEYKVIFVDFGNIAFVLMSDMRSLNQMLKSQPCSAVRVGLKDVPMKPFTASALEYINYLSNNNEPLTTEYEDLSAVRLLMKDKTVLNDKINELMIPGWVKAKEEGADPSANHVLRRNNLQPAPKRLPKNETVELFLLSILPFSGDNLQFVMLDLKSDVTKHVLKNMKDDIEEYCKSLPSDDKYVPRTGELCLAKYAEDGTYYRAECVKANEFSASVLFIDYGNCGDVPYNEIHKMPLDLVAVPAAGIFCNVTDIPFSKEIYDKVVKVISSEIYSVKILKDAGEDYDVQIPEVTKTLRELNII
ncbi:uncharacterized protein LOC142325515 isoform X2 [Lycorma delicatula]